MEPKNLSPCYVFALEIIASLLPMRNVAGDVAFLICEPKMWNTLLIQVRCERRA